MLALIGLGCADREGPDRPLAGPRGLAICPTLRPLRPSPVAKADRACQRALARAATAYAVALLRAEQACVDANHPGPRVEGDPVHPCVGLRELSTGAYRPPAHAPTAAAVARAAEELRSRVRAACDDATVARLATCADSVEGAIDCLRAEHWEAAQHLLREEYGDLLPIEDEQVRSCRGTVGAASRRLLAAQAGAIADCLLALRPGATVHAARECIGEASEGRLVAPEDEATATSLEAAEAVFRREIADGCREKDPPSLDACGQDRTSLEDCLVCAHRREAILLVQSQFGGIADRATTHFIDWAALENPVVGWDDRRIKDQVMAFHAGRFYVIGSIGFADDDPARDTRVGTYVRSTDWRSWEEIPMPIDQTGGGFGSPDLTFHDGRWYVVFQNPDPANPENRRLFLTTTPDLMRWTRKVEIARNVLRGRSIIDGALAHKSGRLHLLLKWRVKDIPWVAVTSGDPTGDWELDDRLVAGNDHPFWGFAENGQFIEIDGRIRMLATARDPEGFRCANVFTCSHEPFLYDFAEGDGTDVRDWTRWRHKTQLRIPYEAWNPVMHANTSFLADWRAYDGFFYLSYSGSADSDSFQGRGHGMIGLARSRDLVHWRLPGDLRD